MPKIKTNRSITINAPASKVFKFINDLKEWKHWSPWLNMEPEHELIISEDHKFQQWKGKRIGEGSLKVTSEKENQSIDLDLEFLKPWKSSAKTRLELIESDKKTKITWYMDSSLPFFLFWMKKPMEAFIGMDYLRGLLMLKDLVEVGSSLSQLDFKGISKFEGFTYIGIRNQCTSAEIGEVMKKDFEKLAQFFLNKEDIMSGSSFAQYHDYDLVKGKVDYTIGISVKHVPELVDSLITGKLEESNVYILRHTGPYRHLGNPWTTLKSMERRKEFKTKKKYYPFELYINNPQTTKEEELITDVCMPVV